MNAEWRSGALDVFELNGHRVRPSRIDIGVGEPIEILQLAEPESALEGALRGERDPYGGMLWPSAIAAARALLPHLRPGLRVIDAGAGTGLISLVAARAGAAVLALDHDPVVLTLIACAAERQGLHLDTQHFDLTASTPLPASDVVVFSDVLYQRDFSLVVAGRAVEAVRQGALVLVADPGRIGRDAFTTAVAAHGLDAVFEGVSITVPGEDRLEQIGLALLRHAP